MEFAREANLDRFNTTIAKGLSNLFPELAAMLGDYLEVGHLERIKFVCAVTKYGKETLSSPHISSMNHLGIYLEKFY